MKLKPIVSGTLLYLGLLIILIGAVILDGMLVPQPLPTRYLFTIFISSLFCGALYFRIREKASFVHAAIALTICFAILLSLVIIYDLATRFGDYFIPLLYLVAVGLICVLGIGCAKLLLMKWNSGKARRNLARLALLPLLLTSLVLFLFDCSAYLHTGIRSQRLGVPALAANVDDLMTTKVVPELGEKISKGTNLIWCATFQTAWNEMVDLVGEEIRFAENEPASVARLNQRETDASQLDPDTFLSFGGPYTRKFIHAVNESIDAKFGTGTFEDHARPLEDDPRELAALAYLSTNLSFKHAFERTEYGMEFKGKRVESFTIPFSRELQTHAGKAKRQVRIQYPPEDGAFIVELITSKRDHHLILANVAPEATLAATIDKTMAFADSLDKKYLETNQHLEVPLFNFDITKNYEELIEKSFALQNPDFRSAYIGRAQQKIRFQLDERGAALKSNAFVVCAKCMPPMDCVFDKPFLLMLRYRDSDKPYYAMWIDNAEILVEKEKKGM